MVGEKWLFAFDKQRIVYFRLKTISVLARRYLQYVEWNLVPLAYSLEIFMKVPASDK